jgi:hypothetical protein
MSRQMDREKSLSEMLDQAIREGNLGIALSALGMVKDTFSGYEHYIKLVNEKLPNIQE